ncbi:MAG TPA: glycosyltransferase family 2 protein [Sphingobacteriaceae bacterium]
MTPLISIVVITYNSAEYVLETLESTKAQTYQNIELIISDDASADKTVQLCEKWLTTNQSRFTRVQLLKSKKNSGVSANCNRGLYASKGEWIKFIAGDDILLDECIAMYYKFISRTKSLFIFSIPSVLISPENEPLKNQMENFYRSSSRFFSLNARKQFEYLLINQIPVNPPTLFCNRQALIRLKGFDERHKCEDLPLYLNATYNGYTLGFINKKTIRYRLHSNQLSVKDQKGSVNRYWFYEQLRIKRQYLTIRFIFFNPLLFAEYLIEQSSKILIMQADNNRFLSSLVSLLKQIKSRISFSYIR